MSNQTWHAETNGVLKLGRKLLKNHNSMLSPKAIISYSSIVLFLERISFKNLAYIGIGDKASMKDVHMQLLKHIKKLSKLRIKFSLSKSCGNDKGGM